MVNNPITKYVGEDGGGEVFARKNLGGNGVKAGGGSAKDQRGEKWEK